MYLCIYVSMYVSNTSVIRVIGRIGLRGVLGLRGALGVCGATVALPPDGRLSLGTPHGAIEELNLIGKALTLCEGGLVAHYLSDRGNNLKSVVVNDKLNFTKQMCCGAESLDLATMEILPAHMPLVAAVICVSTALAEVNLAMNKCFDAQSAKAFSDAVLKSNVKTLTFGLKTAFTILIAVLRKFVFMEYVRRKIFLSIPLGNVNLTITVPSIINARKGNAKKRRAVSKIKTVQGIWSAKTTCVQPQI